MLHEGRVAFECYRIETRDQRGTQHPQRGDGDQDHEGNVDDGAAYFPRLLAALFLEQLDKDGNENRSEDASEDKLVDDVRSRVRDVVGVGKPALDSTQCSGDRCEPSKTGDAREDGPEGHHRRRARERAQSPTSASALLRPMPRNM